MLIELLAMKNSVSLLRLILKVMMKSNLMFMTSRTITTVHKEKKSRMQSIILTSKGATAMTSLRQSQKRILNRLLIELRLKREKKNGGKNRRRERRNTEKNRREEKKNTEKRSRKESENGNRHSN